MKKLLFISCILLLTNVLKAQSVEAKKWTLQECIAEAQKRNLEVQDAQLNVDNAGYSLDQNRYNQLPTVNAGAGYGFNWGRSIDPTTNQFRTERINSLGVNANANLVLWNGLQVRNSISQSKNDAIASEFELQTQKNNIALMVSNAYLNVVLNKEILQNNSFQLDIVNKQLERTQKLVNAGSLPVSNKLDLESQVSTAELNVITAENNVSISLLNLKQFLLIPASTPFDVAIPEVQDPGEIATNNSAEDIYGIAQENLPDLKSVKYRTESAESAQNRAQGGYYPTLSLNASVRSNYSSAANVTPQFGTVSNASTGYFLTDNNGDPVELYLDQGGSFSTVSQQFGFTGTESGGYPIGDQIKDNVSQSLSLNISIPIFNNMQTRINVQRSKIAYERTLLNEKRVENRVRNDIEQAHNNTVATRKTYQARQKQVAALKESFRVTEQRYNLGSVNSTEYQVALNNLNAAETDLVRAKYDYIFSLKVLDFYQGNPLD